MNWPWQRQSNPAPAPAVDVEAVVSAAVERATAAVREEHTQVLRQILGGGQSEVPVQGPYAVQQSPYGIFAFNHPIYYSTPHSPDRRPGQLITVETLRRLADTYDVLRACLQQLKREVAAVPLRITARDRKDESEGTRRRIREAEAWFGVGGGLGGYHEDRQTFEGMVLEDLMVVGAGAVFFSGTRGGTVYEALPIDAATIRPRVDAYGWPGPGEVAYEQWIEGLMVRGYTRDELCYRGLSINARSYTPYYASPVEWLANVINSALRADQWNQAWLTDGNTPSDLIALPETWNPDQIRTWAAYWDGLLAGDSKARQKTKFVPGGSQRVGPNSRKDQEFSLFELWLLRRTCAIMGVQPASIGFVGEQYKVTQEASMDATTAFGAGILLDYRKTLYDDLLVRLGYPDLEAHNVTAREESATERAGRLVQLTGAGIFTPNEARAEEGMDPIEGGDTLLVPSGLRPLEQALEPPEPPGADDEDPAATTRRALSRWESRAVRRFRETGSAECPSESPALPPELRRQVLSQLASCDSVAAVRRVFRKVTV